MAPRAVLWLLLSVAVGCTGVSVRPITGPDFRDSLEDSVVGADDLSPRSLQVLRRWDLEYAYHRDAADALARLHSIALEAPRPELLYTLAELSYLLGRRHEKASGTVACGYYYLCAGYAYHYLFDGWPEVPGVAEQPQAARLDPAASADSPFDPRFRLACDLYNAGLAKCIRAAQRTGQLDPRQQLQLPTADGRGFTLTVQHLAFPWKDGEFGPLLFCSDYQVQGMANHYRTYGLGVPLIATRAEGVSAPSHAFYPREVSFPVTAFFRFEGTIADLRSQRAGRLELYNPLAVQTVAVRGRPVPLETDLTTPLAYFLAHSDLGSVNYVGFLEPDKVEARSGIYMMEPYQPGKIPVLMVHGLLSSPLTWAPMFNDLRADPELRERFQFWFYLYPTGGPYLEPAADLREDLAKLRRELDPQGRDPALDHMVFVGHSMGGLVSHLMTVDSGNDFWSLFSDEPFSELKASAETRADFEPLFFFTQQPCVERVVFIGTPHRGSKLGPSLPGRLAAHFVALPKTLKQSAHDLLQANPGVPWKSRLPTSVDLLAPDAPALKVLVSKPRPPGVHFHSIIGQAPPSSTVLEVGSFFGENDERSDGVVPYSSAHLDDVESEIVVEADHNHVHQHPLAVREVQRILMEHWQTAAQTGQRADGRSP